MKSALGVLGCNCDQPVALGATTFSADQVIGKTLVAKKTIQLKASATDAAPAVATVQPLQPVGTVYSYLNPAPGRASLYWQITSNGKNYFVKHEVGAFDVTDLRVQGAKTAEEIFAEQKAKEEKENDPIIYYVKKLGVPLALGAAAVYLIATFGKQFLASKLSSKPSLTGPSDSKMWWIGGGALALIGGAIYFIKAKKQSDASKAFVDYVQGNNAELPQPIVANKLLPSSMPVLKTSLPEATPIANNTVVTPMANQPIVLSKRKWIDENLQSETAFAGFNLLR